MMPEHEEDDRIFMDNLLDMLDDKEGLYVRYDGKVRLLSELPEAVALDAIQKAVAHRQSLMRII